MKLARKTILIFSVAIILSAIGYYFYNPSFQNTSTTPIAKAIKVKVATVTQQDIAQTITLSGTVYANANVALKSRLDSQITAIFFADGQLVKQGQDLFKLDDRALQTQRTQLLATQLANQAAVMNAETIFMRSTKLNKQGFVANEKLEQDRTNLTTAQANLAITKAALAANQVELGYTQIKAPITGRVGTIALTVGNIVKANDSNPLVTINQVDPILVQFALPQIHYDQIKQAMAKTDIDVNVKRADSDISLTGKLDYLENFIDSQSGTVLARARFQNTAEQLWPGMFVSVSLTPAIIKNALTLPAAAIQGKAEAHFVFLAGNDGKASRKAVTITTANDSTVIIKSGLALGDKVIIDGLLRVTEGAPLELMPAAIDAADNKNNVTTAPVP